MISIAVSGTHGIGKTSLISRLESELKARNYVVSIVRESARNCPFKIGAKGNIYSQLWILLENCKKEFEERNNPANDFVLIDRPIFDAFAYVDYLYKRKRAIEDWDMAQFVVWFNALYKSFEYDYVFLLRHRLRKKITKDRVRDTDLQYQKYIQRKIPKYLQYYKVKFYSCHESRIDQRLSFIIEQLSKDGVVKKRKYNGKHKRQRKQSRA